MASCFEQATWVYLAQGFNIVLATQLAAAFCHNIGQYGPGNSPSPSPSWYAGVLLSSAQLWLPQLTHAVQDLHSPDLAYAPTTCAPAS